MKRRLRVGLNLFGILLVGIIIVAGWYLNRAMPVGVGYVAKYLCSNTFISQRDPQVVFEEDVKPVNPLAHVVRWKVDREDRSVTASAFGRVKAKAVYREGCGCTLVVGAEEEAVRGQTFYQAAQAYAPVSHDPNLPWPEGSGGAVDPASLGVDGKTLDRALDAAFAEPGPDNPRKTRAVVVIYDGHLIAERYAPGFGPDTPLLGWSMAKSITNALVGILVREGALDIHKPAPVPEWQEPDDPRSAITLDQLLRMSSGLAFEERYEPLYDAVDMLYGAPDFAAFAAEKTLEAEPDTKWSYSSGSANIVARIVRRAAEKRYDHYYDFLRRQLFDQIGMSSALVEADPSGTFVGSSYGIATPRDWARFGLLYLQDGVWKGERILPEGWVTYSTTPTPTAPRGEYGAFFWLNAGAPDNPSDRLWPNAPRDAFAAQGFQEQKVIVIPSRKVVLIRFGATSRRDTWDTDRFITDVLETLPPAE
ncbi:MAG: serine hydrolase [Syntrophales bacterium]|nr:serine hydrolase [Syntrophales bacterium]